jgi:hypothetical protein
MNPLTISPDRLSFLDGGVPFVQRGCLTWPLLGVYLNDGELAAAELIKDRRSVGANTISVIGMWSRYKNLHPSHPQYWDSLRPLSQIAADEGMRLQWVVLADTRPTAVWLDTPGTWPGMPDLGSQLAHWERFLVTLGDFNNVTFIVANQPGHPSQTITPAQTTQFVVPQVGDFPKLLAARNNPFEDSNPTLPPMDFSCYCSSRRYPKGVAELGYSMWNVIHGWQEISKWSGTRQVSILFEPPRISEGNGWDDPGRWRQMARSLCYYGVGGGNVYSDQDRFGLPFTGVTRDCAVEFLGNIPNP